MIWYTLGLLFLAFDALLISILIRSSAFYWLSVLLVLTAWATTFGVSA